ncbi:MAG: beta-galactosidase [Candidatus Asgardarchaeia archaeon]
MTLERRIIFRHSGEFHYFRILVNLWEKNIPRLRELKIETVSTYIPWVWHEVDDGVFDFHGETHPQRDLLKFLELCRNNGYSVVIRPGPYIYAEYTGLGVPLWLMKKHPEALVVNETGKKLNMITYGHPILMEYTRRWYKQLMQEIKEYLDDGTIKAIQIDNEAGQILTAESFNKVDYNPFVMERYREWLRKQYDSINDLNKDFKTSFSDFSKVTPPKGKISVKYGKFWLSWFKFYQEFIVDYLKELMKIAKEEGFPEDKFTLNDSIILMHPARTRDKYKLAPLGLDIYVKVAENLDTPFDFPYSPTFYSKYERYYSDLYNHQAFGFEVQCGWLNPYTKVSNESTWQLALSLLSHGVSGINWYIIHDAIEADDVPYAYNSAFNTEGEFTERAKVITKIGELIDEYKDFLHYSKEIYDDVAYLHYEDYIINTLYCLLDLAYFPRARNAFLGAIADSGWNYGFVDLELASSKELQKFKTLVFFSLGFLDTKSYQKLLDFVSNGGRLITYPYPIIYNENFEESFHELYPVKPSKLGGYNIKIMFLKLFKWITTWRLTERRKYHHRGCDLVIRGFYINRKLIDEGIKQAKTFEFFNQEVKGYLKFNEFKFENTSKNVIPLLAANNRKYGYIAKVGGGESIVLGTNLFLEYDTHHYYTLLNKEKMRNKLLLEVLLRGMSKITSEPPVETVVRHYKDLYGVFVFNRGPKKRIKISGLDNILKKEEIKVIDNIALSSKNVLATEEKNLVVDLESNDATLILLNV